LKDTSGIPNKKLWRLSNFGAVIGDFVAGTRKGTRKHPQGSGRSEETKKGERAFMSLLLKLAAK